MLPKYILILNTLLLTGCISTRESHISHAQGLERTQHQQVSSQGQSLTDILSLFIAQETGLSQTLLLGITNGSTIHYINNKFSMIEQYRDNEKQLRDELFGLGKELEKLKSEHITLQKALRNLTNLNNSQKNRLKRLNHRYAQSVRSYEDKLNEMERYIHNSNKIVKKKNLLSKIEEYKNELNYL